MPGCAVENSCCFPQLWGAFPLPFRESIRLRAESVVLDSGVFRDLTEATADSPSCGLSSSRGSTACTAMSLV